MSAFSFLNNRTMGLGRFSGSHQTQQIVETQEDIPWPLRGFKSSHVYNYFNKLRHLRESKKELNIYLSCIF